MNRRTLLKALAATAVSWPRRGDASALITSRLGEIEEDSRGRLGVHIIDTAAGASTGFRNDERFALCSTFKLPLAAIVLREADAGRLSPDDRIRFTEDDLVPYAPVVERNLDRGYMTIAELAAAAQTTSDNVAANLLLELIDGPAGFTSRIRALGDDVTRLDRNEPTMNLVGPGEARDTTTPRAMASLVNTILFGALLEPESQAQLREWLFATTTGKRRLKAGLPADWRVGNKTGTGVAEGLANKYNDVAVAWPGAGEDALIIAAYFEADDHYPRIRSEDEDVLRRVAEVATAVGARPDGRLLRRSRVRTRSNKYGTLYRLII